MTFVSLLSRVAQIPSCYTKVHYQRTRLACVASVSVGFGSKELLPPSFLFWLSPHFRTGKTPEMPFLGLSLLPKPTETLATQARTRLVGNRASKFSHCACAFILVSPGRGMFFTSGHDPLKQLETPSFGKCLHLMA